MTAPLTTGHVGLNVTDLTRAIAFYATLFDFETLSTGDGEHRFAMLGHDGAPILTLWEQSAGAFSTAAPGLHHLSFEVETVEQVRQAEQTLRRLGARFAYDGVVAHGTDAASGGIFFEDPDGIRLEIYAARAGEGAQAPVAGAPTCGFF